jgi:hypothetical protein
VLDCAELLPSVAEGMACGLAAGQLGDSRDGFRDASLRRGI